MISIIENEEELENVVGGIKAKHVVKITLGVVSAAVLVVGGKFVYDVYTEYNAKTNSSGDVRGAFDAFGSWGKDVLDEAHMVHKSPWERAVTKTTNAIIQFQSENRR